MMKLKFVLFSLLVLVMAIPALAGAASASYPTVSIEGLENGVSWLSGSTHVVRWSTTGTVTASTVSVCKDNGYQPLWTGNGWMNNGSNCKIVNDGNMVTKKWLEVSIPQSFKAQNGDVFYVAVTFWGSQYGNFSQRFVYYLGQTAPTSVADSPAYEKGKCYPLNLNGRTIIQNSNVGNDYEIVERVGKYLSHEINPSTGATYLNRSYKEPYYRDYDSAMVSAVKAWQGKNGLSVNGVVNNFFEDKLKLVTNCWENAKFTSLSLTAVAPNISKTRWARGTSKIVSWAVDSAPVDSIVKIYLKKGTTKTQIGNLAGYNLKRTTSGSATIELPISFTAGDYELVAEMSKSEINSGNPFAPFSAGTIAVGDAIQNVKVVAADAGANPVALDNWIAGGNAKVYFDLFDLNSNTALDLKLYKVNTVTTLSPSSIFGSDSNTKVITLKLPAYSTSGYTMTVTPTLYPSLKVTSSATVNVVQAIARVTNVGILPSPNTNNSRYITEWKKGDNMSIFWTVNNTPITYGTNASVILEAKTGTKIFVLNNNTPTINGKITSNLLGAGLGDNVPEGYYRVGVKYGVGNTDVSYTGYFMVKNVVAPTVSVDTQASWPANTYRNIAINTAGFEAGTIFRLYACQVGDVNCAGTSAGYLQYRTLGEVVTTTKSPEKLISRNQIMSFTLAAKSVCDLGNWYVRVEKGKTTDSGASIQMAKSNDFAVTCTVASAQTDKEQQLAAAIESLQQLINSLKGN